mgnify:CR=1 FL=1
MSGRHGRLLAAILAVYVLVTVGYSVANPLFEAPDEHWHYLTAQYIADNGRLPRADEDFGIWGHWMGQEVAQPPLYYALGALLIRPIHAQPQPADLWRNLFVGMGDASVSGNINYMIHTPREAWPWQDFALAAHVLRVFSVLLGLGTLLCLYGSARLLWPHHPERALLATALVAFLPQFNFLHASATNDALIIFLCAAGLWQLLRLWQTGVSWPRLLLLGLTAGLAILAKNAGALFLAYAGGVLSLLWLRDRQIKPMPLKILMVYWLWLFVPALLVGGWLWVRNWLLYSDITAMSVFVAAAGGDRHYSLAQVLADSDGLWVSLLAVFGWLNLRPPDWVYWVWNGLIGVALIGVLKELADWALRTSRGRPSPYPQNAASLSLEEPKVSFFLVKGRAKRPFAPTPGAVEAWEDGRSSDWLMAFWLALWVLVVYAGLVFFMIRTEAAQGRLLLPALTPLALGLVYGLSRWRTRLAYVGPALLALLTTVYCLLFVVRPAYALPPVVAALPETAVPLHADLGQGLELVGAEINQPTAKAGDLAWFTLYWRATAPPPVPPEFVLDVLGREQAVISHVHSYHGRGLYPATLWPPNAIIADRVAAPLADTAVVPVLAPVWVQLAGETARVQMVSLKVTPRRWPDAAPSPLLQVGEGVELTAVTIDPQIAAPGSTLTVTVQWRVTTPPGGAFTTLLHLGTGDQPPLATGDSPPLRGAYPTSAWAAGEVIDDQYTLTLPEGLGNGRYPLWLGMYDADLIRLPLFAAGERVANDVYRIGEVEIRD